MKKYQVVALTVSGLGKRIFRSRGANNSPVIVTEKDFAPGNADAFVKSGHLKEITPKLPVDNAEIDALIARFKAMEIEKLPLLTRPEMLRLVKTLKLTTSDKKDVTLLAALTNFKAPEGDAPEGDAPEGDAPEGDAPEGEAPEGDAPEGDAPEGEAPEGEAPEGEVPEGDAPEGDAPEGEVPEGDAPEGDAPAQTKIKLD